MTDRETLIAEALDRIERAATAIPRLDEEGDKRAVASIRANTDRIRAILNPVPPSNQEPNEPAEPPPGGGTGPGGGGTTPPPAGPWVDPTKTGAGGTLTPVHSSWGINIEDAGLLSASDTQLSSDQGNATTSTHYHGVKGLPVRWSNMRTLGRPQDNAFKWNMIAFDALDWEFEHSTWSDNPLGEHAQYITCLGGLKWDHCLFTNIGSQGLQLVGAVPGTPREKQTAFYSLDGSKWWAAHDPHKWEWVEVLDCAFIQVGLPHGDRPSFAFSAFDGPLNPVRLARCVFQTSAPHLVGGINRDCYGAAFAHNRLRFEMLECYISYLNGDRDVVQSWYNGDGDPSTVDVTIRGCEINSNQYVDIRVKPTDVVRIQGNAGTARVRVTTAPKYIWPTNPAWQQSWVLYDGPITQDWSMN